MKRRHFAAMGLASAGGATLAKMYTPRRLFASDQRPKRSRVAVLSADSYSDELDGLLFGALRLFPLDVKGRTVLLKPNLVEYIAGAEVNTHPSLVGAASEAFRRLGARRVIVGEGPGHQRDTQLVLAESGFEQHLRERNIEFVDLNRDDIVEIETGSCYTAMKSLWLPKAVLEVDLVVSMPKVKTHHWAGVTLSMKNMFGVIPGEVYGWPKNVLHWQGIERSILDICSTIRPHFVIADGIIAMEGNGPLHGSHRGLHKIVLADDPVSADFTCARMMGLIPERIYHLAQASRFIGNGDPGLIDLLAESLPLEVQPFAVLPQFRYLQVA